MVSRIALSGGEKRIRRIKKRAHLGLFISKENGGWEGCWRWGGDKSYKASWISTMLMMLFVSERPVGFT